MTERVGQLILSINNKNNTKFIIFLSIFRGLSTHRTKDLYATVSYDGYLKLWRINNNVNIVIFKEINN